MKVKSSTEAARDTAHRPERDLERYDAEEDHAEDDALENEIPADPGPHVGKIVDLFA